MLVPNSSNIMEEALESLRKACSVRTGCFTSASKSLCDTVAMSVSFPSYQKVVGFVKHTSWSAHLRIEA